MQRNDIDQEPKDDRPSIENPDPERDPEHPVPGVEHYDEADAENIMPAEDRPGTF